MLDLPQIRVSFEEGVPADAPFLDGHFDDRPIVPGAVLLAYAAEALAARGLAIASVARLKFQQPLSPGVPFAIELEGKPESLRIAWRTGDGVIARAQVALRPHG